MTIKLYMNQRKSIPKLENRTLIYCDITSHIIHLLVKGMSRQLYNYLQTEGFKVCLFVVVFFFVLFLFLFFCLFVFFVLFFVVVFLHIYIFFSPQNGFDALLKQD